MQTCHLCTKQYTHLSLYFLESLTIKLVSDDIPLAHRVAHKKKEHLVATLIPHLGPIAE